MSTTQVHLERRGAQRFDCHLPVAVHSKTSGADGHGFTQDLSARGIFFYADFALSQGDEVELTLMMPSEITLGENMRVCCRGKVLRVARLASGEKCGIAVHFEGYEYLTEAVSSASRDSRPLHESTPEDEAGMTAHTFTWRGNAFLSSR